MRNKLPEARDLNIKPKFNAPSENPKKDKDNGKDNSNSKP